MTVQYPAVLRRAIDTSLFSVKPVAALAGFLLCLSAGVASAADLDNDGLDGSIETCDGNWIDGVNAGTCDTASSCNANAMCVGTYDYDGDGVSDFNEFNAGTNPVEPDTDNDGITDPLDNCIDEPNPGQENLDGDAFGDVCDADDDNDGTDDVVDNCPLIANASQLDTDNDSQGDACDNDDDGDGLDDGVDNCPQVVNVAQIDTDNDGSGDQCDGDADPDGDMLDNAYEMSIGTDINNADTDGDQVSDFDEDALGSNPLLADSDNDGVRDSADMFPNDVTRILACVPGDANGDGLVNAADVILVQQHVLGTNPLSCQ